MGLVLVALAPVDALAHASVVSSTPADGSVWDQPPRRLEITFDSAIHSAGRPVELRDQAGARVALADVAVRGSTLTARVAAPLGEGAYAVHARVRSSENHVVDAHLRFTVAAHGKPAGTERSGNAPVTVPPLTPQASGDADGAGLATRATPVWRIAELAAAAVIVAATAVWIAVAEPVVGVGGRARRRRRRLAVAGVSVLAGARVAAAVATTADVAGFPTMFHVAPIDVAATFMTGSGRWHVGLVLHALGSACAVASNMKHRRSLSLAAAAAVVAGTAMGTHTGAGLVAGIFSVAHLAAAMVWIAAPVALLGAISLSGSRPRALRALGRRAGGVAIPAVAALMLTGAGMVVAGGSRELALTPHTKLLLLKFLAIGVVLAVAVLSHRYARRGDSRLRRPVAVETAALTAVVVLAAMLAATPVTDDPANRSIIVAGPSAVQSQLALSPGHVGTNSISFAPPPELRVSHVTLQLRSQSLPIATPTISLRAHGTDPSLFVGNDLVIAQPGVWAAVVTVVTGDERVEFSGEFLATEGSPA